MLSHPNSKYLQDGRHIAFEKLCDTNKNLINKTDLLISIDQNIIDYSSIEQFSSFRFSLKSSVNFLLQIFYAGAFRTPLTYSMLLMQYLYYYFNIIIKILLSSILKAKKKNLLRSINRLHNISESHYELMHRALLSKCDFAIILEDDAIESASFPLKTLLESLTDIFSEDYPNILSISESFNFQKLGISNLITGYSPLKGGKHKVFYFRYPVTNTVCAMVYTKTSLDFLIKGLTALRPYSLIPIDHKINVILSDNIKRGVIAKNCLAYLSPGAFIQGSIFDRE